MLYAFLISPILAVALGVVFFFVANWKFAIDSMTSKESAAVRQDRAFGISLTAYLPLSGMLLVVPAMASGNGVAMVVAVVLAIVLACFAADSTARSSFAFCEGIRALARHQLAEDSWPFFCQVFIDKALRRAESSGLGVPAETVRYLNRMKVRSTAFSLI